MAVIAAYISVIIIWSTTPLAIQWSSVGVGYEFAVALRMLIGLVALILIIRLWRLQLPIKTTNWPVYLAGGLSLFMAMTCVYWSAQYIPSGWIAVLFGLTPFVTSLLAWLILGNQSFSAEKTVGMLFGLAGLIVVFFHSLDMPQQAWKGVIAIIIATLFHSLGAVLLKRLNSEIHPVSITAGSLLIATPLFSINSLLAGLPSIIPQSSLMAIVYLALMGSALGFPMYYFCLKKLTAEKMALVTLITPVTALLLGSQLNNEQVSRSVWIGTLLIVFGLAIYQYGRRLFTKQHTAVSGDLLP